MSRWNPDNPTGSIDLGSPSRSRRSLTASQQSQFASSVFGSVPQPRTGPLAARDLAARVLDGACETKQTAFEWPVRNVRALQAQLESAVEAEEVHDVLSGDGCYFDDLAYKLHLERAPDVHIYTPLAEEPQERNTDPKVTLAVIALWAKYSDLPQDEAFERTVFVGIKRYEAEHERSLGEPSWLWTTSETTSFSKRQEYWEVTLPSLRDLLRDADVSDRDAFSIRVVIKHASEPSLPPMVHADQQFISRRVTRQAAGFLDSIRTGDVRFIVLEHAANASNSDLTADTAVGTGMARRRVIYAHSELLQHTDYFKAALGPSWSESAEAGVRTLSVDDASFATLYWVLRWIYTDEIRFGLEPVRDVMAHVRLDHSASARILRGDSWDFQPLDDEDARTVRSVSSSGTAATGASVSGARSPARSAASNASRLSPPPPTPGQTPHATPKKNSLSPGSASGGGSATPSPSTQVGSAGAPPSALPRISRNAKKPPPSASPSRPYVTPRRSHAAPQDPHAHPTPPPDPPSPLAAFFLAHRYGLEELQAIARDTLLKQLTPDTCVAALLATYAFPDLHAAILDYVSDNWADVTQSPELERCYQEVSAGVWGENHGGQVLLGLTRRLTGMSL